MAKRGPRPVFFVCIGLDSEKPNEIISKQIQAASQNEAASLFYEMTQIKSKIIYGPYRLKRAQVLENTRVLRFSEVQKTAIYNEWYVNAVLLKEPEGQAYLFFIKRIDDKKQSPPKGTVLVPISDLRFINE